MILEYQNVDVFRRNFYEKADCISNVGLYVRCDTVCTEVHNCQDRKERDSARWCCGDLSFFKKHSDLSNYAKHTLPQDKKTIYWTTAISVKDEKELGNFHKTYKENENEVVRKICEIHKETDSKYALAWVDLGDIVVRAVFQYQKGKLTYDRLNYFDEQNEVYMAYLAKKNAKEEKIESTVKSVVGTVLGSSTNSITSNSNARGADTNNQQERTYTYTDGDGNVIYSKTLILP